MQRSMESGGLKQPDQAGIEFFRTFMRVRRLSLPMALIFAICAVPGMAQGTDGKDLRGFYQQNCARCHGPDGSAVGAEGKKLSGQDFTDMDWQRRTPDDKMVKTILDGKFFGWAMPSFKDTLTPDEAQQMVTDIIRNSKKGQVIAPEAESPGGK